MLLGFFFRKSWYSKIKLLFKASSMKEFVSKRAWRKFDSKINLTCFILYWISYGNVLHVTFFSIAGRNRNLLCSYLLGRSFTENSCFRICFTQRSISEKYLEHNGFCSRSHGVSILCSREITHFWKFVALLSREVENIERKKNLNQNRPILMWTCFILATLHVCL